MNVANDEPAAHSDDLDADVFFDHVAASVRSARPARFQIPAGTSLATTPLATVEDIFHILCRAGDAWRGNRGLNFGMWLDGAFPMDCAALFARADDGDFEGFIERVTAPRGTREFCWAQYHAQVFSFNVWRRALGFLAPVLARVGWPTGEVDIDVFAGRYQRTPRGIHTDSAHTFMYVVQGPKTLAFWPDGYFEGRGVHISGARPQRTLVGVDPQPFLADAVVLTATSGELLSWPASFWHIGLHERGAGPTAALNMGLFERQAKDAILMDVLHELLDGVLSRQQPAPQDRAPCLQTMAARVPPEEAQGIETLSALLDQGWIEKLVHTRWLQRISARGFHHVPAPEEHVPCPGGRARLRDAFMPIVWHRFDESMVISSNGHFTRTAYHPALEMTLQRLNSGDALALESSDRAADGLRAQVAEMLSLLVAWRAITWEPESSVTDGDPRE